MKRFLMFMMAVTLGLYLSSYSVSAADLSMGGENLQCSCTCNCQSAPAGGDEGDVVKSYKPGDILISEFVSDPVSGQVEWVELYNLTDEVIDLQNWSLEEGSSQTTALGGYVAAHDYLVIEKSSLNNAGDTIVLRDPVDTVIDHVVYGDWDDGAVADNAPVAVKGESVMRQDVTQDYNIDFQDFVVTVSPTPGEPNILTAPEQDIAQSTDEKADQQEPVDDQEDSYDHSDKIIISEFLPNPEGADGEAEWIELLHTGTETVNLKGWRLDDAEGGSSPYVVSDNFWLDGGEYRILSNDETTIALNNGGDQVRLIDPNGEVVDEISYTQANEGFSYGLIDAVWAWLSTPTPGEANVADDVDQPESDGDLDTSSTGTPSEAEDIPQVSILEARAMPAQDMVTLEGTLTAQPGTFSDKVMYLQDETAGLQVYGGDVSWPQLDVGDRVRVTGKMSEKDSEKRLLVAAADDISVVGQDEVEIQSIETAMLDEVFEGQLVRLSGVFIDKNYATVSFEDQAGEAIVYLKQKTDIKTEDIVFDREVAVSGIVSQSDGVYRVLPRSVADLMYADDEYTESGEEEVLPMGSSENLLLPPNNQRQSTATVIGLSLLLLSGFGGVLLWLHRDKVLAWLRQLQFKKADDG